MPKMVATNPQASTPVGRKHKEFKTKQIRVDEETAHLLIKLAGSKGKDIPDFLREWLRPLLEEEYRRHVEAEYSRIHGKKKTSKNLDAE
jgi:hypothetical protein